MVPRSEFLRPLEKAGADALIVQLSIVIPAHNPNPGRLSRVLTGIREQSLGKDAYETIIIDNASSSALSVAQMARLGPIPDKLHVVREERMGLAFARQAGLRATRGKFVVLVDDDNVLAPDYLEQVLRFFAGHPQVGALGGRSLPEFEQSPASWQRQFFPLLALRDPGDQPKISRGLRPAGAVRNAYPTDAAPIGAGMALRREAALQWLASSSGTQLSDRRGGELTSGGDNDIVLTLMKHGWEVAYSPDLSLTHLIPAGRLDPAYLARLNRGIQKSWMQVLFRHEANPWPPVAPWTMPLRKLKAWFVYRAWNGPAAYIRWQGACGHFEGRAQRSG